MYIILGGGNVVSSEDVLMVINLKRCNFDIPEGLKVEEYPHDVTPRTLIITVDGRGIYTNSMTSTILNRIKRWRRKRDV